MSDPCVREICLYAAASHLGGAERSLLEIATTLHNRSAATPYRPWVLLPRAGGPLQAELEAANIPYGVLSIPESFYKMSRSQRARSLLQAALSSPEVWTYVRELSTLLRNRGTALIHSNGVKCHLLSAGVRARIGIPVIWHMRDIFGTDQDWVRSGLRLIGDRSGVHVVANSIATAQSYRQDFASRGSRVEVVYNGIDPIRYHPSPSRRYNERLGLPPDAKIVGIVGALARWKGQREFLKMARLLQDRSAHRIGFVIVGDEIYDTGSERGVGDELRAEAERLGIRSQVLFTGFEMDPVHAMNALDVLVHASLRPEPFGRVIIEAMACGVPVVGARAGGVTELIEEGKSGLLHDPGDVEGMARAVKQLLEHPELRESLRTSARERFLANFTAERSVQRLEACYDRVLGFNAEKSSE